jgi:hypothetical protein
MIGVEEIGGALQFVPVTEFEYPDDGDRETPVVRDERIQAPLMKKCEQRFAVVPGGDVMTMPLLDKRLEVLRYALREAVERMDFTVIHRLVQKAIATVDRIAAERLAANTPAARERVEEIVIHDDAESGKVIIHFAEPLDARNRRWMRICGFSRSGDQMTYWRKRTFRRDENIALERARHCVQHIVENRARLAASEHEEFLRETSSPLCA